MKYSYVASGRNGYERILGIDADLRFFREYGVLHLNLEDSFEDDSDSNEVMLHIVRGTCSIQVGSETIENLGMRASPSDGKPTAIYVPPQIHFQIVGKGLEAVISRAPAGRGSHLKIVRAEDLAPTTVGKENWRRTVTLIAPPDFSSQSLIVGETLNPSGNWSGVPAHKHDQIDAPNESIQEEIYYFRIVPKNGWGFLRIYDKNGLDELIRLTDRSVTVIPKGYHTVAAAPGSTLFYTFHLAGPEKRLVVTEDPDQVWIKQK